MAAIETTGETVSEETNAKDIPVYTVARAVEWLKRPENAPRIELAAEMAGEATKNVAQGIDREVTKVGRLLRDLATDDDILEDFKNDFLKKLFDL